MCAAIYFSLGDCRALRMSWWLLRLTV